MLSERDVQVRRSNPPAPFRPLKNVMTHTERWKLYMSRSWATLTLFSVSWLGTRQVISSGNPITTRLYRYTDSSFFQVFLRMTARRVNSGLPNNIEYYSSYMRPITYPANREEKEDKAFVEFREKGAFATWRGLGNVTIWFPFQYSSRAREKSDELGVLEEKNSSQYITKGKRRREKLFPWRCRGTDRQIYNNDDAEIWSKL